MSREQFWFVYPLRVRYSEVDCQGVVFNANYLMYFDTTITEYFRALGYDQQADAKKTGVDFHVVKSLIEYKAPVGSTGKSTSVRGWRVSAIQALFSNSPSF
jgi:acyl-CoA thioester hydrolase